MSGLLTMLALGFFLGVRHATDPDHVIAVTTIVARHRATTAAALIGTVWGVGHTLTLVIVGGGIVLFGWVIPRHIGLSASSLRNQSIRVSSLWTKLVVENDSCAQVLCQGQSEQR